MSVSLKLEKEKKVELGLFPALFILIVTFLAGVGAGFYWGRTPVTKQTRWSSKDGRTVGHSRD